MTFSKAVRMCIATTAIFATAGSLSAQESPMHDKAKAPATAPARPEIYAPVTLTADLSGLSGNERKMLSLFVDAAAIMDDLFWRQAYGDKRALRNLKDERIAVTPKSITDPGSAGRQCSVVPAGSEAGGAQFYPLT
jgi:hypothetical protein